ncbi:MAG: glycerate kinase [Desulfurococcales archaeon]|nr:glycerate kinase [Desulfurococcales archaeon]
MPLIKNIGELMRNKYYEVVIDLLEVGLRAADPKLAVVRSVSLRGDTVVVCNHAFEVEGKVYVVGFGKASIKMGEGIEEVLGDLIDGGVLIAPEIPRGIKFRKLKVLKGDHPIPGENTLRSTEEVLNLIKSVSSDDLVFVLISGGGSALFEKPMPPITLSDLKELNKLLLKSGADIKEINTVRKHVSTVKGGRLAELIYPAYTIALIVSDVVGDPIEFIASGPTAPDTTTFHDAMSVLKYRGLWDRVPESVRVVIEKGIRGEIPETPKPKHRIFERVSNNIIASNIISLKAMEERARQLGYNSLVLTSMMEGEAREVGKFLAGLAKHIAVYDEPVKKPAIVLLGGETTVTVRGDGIGGRNQELALSFAIHARGLKNAVFASIGTDGIDGVSNAAGAIVDSGTYSEALSKGIDLVDYLQRNDSHTALRKLRRAIFTGYTGTNVNDIAVLLVGK